MIKYYDTLAAYKADVKSNFESQVSLIGADNTVKYDGRNVVIDIRSARTGTIAALDGTHALRFVSVDTFSSESFMSDFEIVGVVVIGVDHPSFRGQIAIMYPTRKSHPMSVIFQWELTGYTLDGTDRTGTLAIREASDNWRANHDYVISYNAADESGLVEQLNTYFRANEPFKTQGWSAYLNEDNTINLSCRYIIWNQHSFNKGKDGFNLSGSLFREWTISMENILLINGSRSDIGAIMNWAKAIDYYRKDNGASDLFRGGRTTDQGSNTKQQYAINLPTWLGTSTQNPGDFCAGLRAIYGEGEAGWLKFMKTMLPLRPTEYGAIGDKAKHGDARRNTYYLASQKYADVDGNIHPASPAANFVANISFDHELLKKGQWVIPDLDLLTDIMADIKYPTTNSRDADIINKALLAIGALAISNKSAYISCSAYGPSMWYYRYDSGCAFNQYSIYLYDSVPVLPLALLDVPSNAKSSAGTLLTPSM